MKSVLDSYTKNILGDHNNSLIYSSFKSDIIYSYDEYGVAGKNTGLSSIFYGDVGGYSNYIFGNNINNVIYGSSANDIIFGFGGNDIIYGGYGNDIIYGGKGSDVVYGGWGDDVFHVWGSGLDYYYGDVGDDLFIIHNYNNGHDYIDGGIGNDTADFTRADHGTGISLSGSGALSFPVYLKNIENALGTNFIDQIYGSARNNRLEGRDGDDIIFGRSGDDVVIGGNGDDQLYGDNNNPLDSDGNDLLEGGNGNDQLYGGGGDDRLYGGPGYDELEGGTGADTFFFTNLDNKDNGNESWGSILDFNIYQGDKIDLSHIVEDELTYIGGTAFSGTGVGEVRIVSAASFTSNDITVYVDSNGDGIANGEFDVHKSSSFAWYSADDFIL